MEVKGSAVSVVPQFVRHQHGEEGYRRWLDAVPAASRKLLAGFVLASDWYPLRDAFVEPTRVMCDLFYGGKLQGAWDVGRFSAEQALRGIYRAFVRIASPGAVLDRGGAIFETYYHPGRMVVAERSANRFVLHMLDVDEPHAILEHRICGWIEGALEICNSRKNRVTTRRSAASGAPHTEIVIEL